MQLKKVSDILEKSDVHLLLNNKMRDFCNYMGIDIFNCDSYKCGRRFSRYINHIVKEPREGGYTYELKKNRYTLLYRDVMANEYHNNMFDMCDYINTKEAFGVSIWLALSLTTKLYEIIDEATVSFQYLDVIDKNNDEYDFFHYPDCPHVTFYVNRTNQQEPETFSAEAIEAPARCRMMIRIQKQ